MHTRCPTKIVLSSIWNLSHASTGLSLVSQLIGETCVALTGPETEKISFNAADAALGWLLFLIIEIIQEKKLLVIPLVVVDWKNLHFL